MEKKAYVFYDAKPYDKRWFDVYASEMGIELKYTKKRLCTETAHMAEGTGGVIAFVNDDLSAPVLDALDSVGVRLVAMRCAGTNNVDLKRAEELGFTVCRVPDYSPNAVAEYAAALMFALNRKIHRAYLRTRDFDFSIDGLAGFDLFGKTAGVVGTGRIGRVFADICRGIGMRVVAYDMLPTGDYEYMCLDELLSTAHVVSLHCPLTADTHHMINASAIERMRDGALLINTSRGGLIDTEALLGALASRKLGGAGLDVYEEESGFFYEDNSDTTVRNDQITRLLTLPNVIITSHQAFLTDEALNNIAKITLNNLAGAHARERNFVLSR